MKNLIKALLLMTLASCATQTKKEIAKEVQEVKVPLSMQQVMQRYQKSIQDSPDLSQIQKDKMIELQQKTYLKANDIRTQIKKLKIVLLNELMSKDYSARKVDLISKQMRDLNKKRIEVMLESLSDAKVILGKQSTTPAVRDFWYFHDNY